MGWGQSLTLTLKAKRHVFNVFLFGVSFRFFCRYGFVRCLEQPGDRWEFGCFGKMIQPIRCCGFHCQVSSLDEMFFYLLLVLEARAAVDITVVRKVFLLDKTFDLPCLSAAVGFTVASVASFRSTQSFLVSSFVLKRSRLLPWASPSFVGCSYLTKSRLSSSPCASSGFFCSRTCRISKSLLNKPFLVFSCLEGHANLLL